MVWPTVRPARSGRTWLPGVVSLALLALALGCEPADPARVGAESFIDRYYVEIDLPAAREHSVGYATVKLDREMKLLEGIDAPESSGKPQVNYRFLAERDGTDDEHRGLLYELTITFGGGEQVVRKALVTVQNDEGQWRVANFQELD